MKPLSPVPSFILVTIAALLAGCAGSQQARFYTLSPLAAPEAKPGPAAQAVSIKITPVQIPDYLNRPQIVTRDGRNELKLAEFDRWGGDLADSIAAVTAENLSLLLGTDRVDTISRARDPKANYTVAIKVLRLDIVPGDQLTLKVQWQLLPGAEDKPAVIRVTNIGEKLKDSHYDTAVAAISSAFEKVSREIAGEIANRCKGPVQPEQAK